MKNLNVKISDDIAQLFAEIKSFVGRKTNDETIELCIRTTHKFIIEGRKP